MLREVCLRLFDGPSPRFESSEGLARLGPAQAQQTLVGCSCNDMYILEGLVSEKFAQILKITIFEIPLLI